MALSISLHEPSKNPDRSAGGRRSDTRRRCGRRRLLRGVLGLLAAEIPLELAHTSGQVVNVSATGQLTIHGVTKAVIIPIQARLSGSQIELAGSITFPFSEFGMTPPSIGGFVSVQDNATMEFDIKLSQQAA